jgi:hypothetical protein
MLNTKNVSRGHGAPVAQHDGRKPSFSDGAKTSADAGKQQDYKYGRGGKNPEKNAKKNSDVGNQSADVAQPGQVGHRSDQDGPGNPAATPGKTKMHGFDGALPAVPGHVNQPNRTDGAGKVERADKLRMAGDDRAKSTREFQGPAAAFGRTVVPKNPPSSVGSATAYDKTNTTSPTREREKRNPLEFQKSRR